ncbi:MAG: LCP family protein [Anaerolineae bacterium]|jgi:LCP family protein required for cell wall assembly|nr:LCP family protein [Ardenticatenia bacterium]HQZ69765.1 LCP family protein [Anaerolineae bacterium]HRA19049.1 LCP family protein [Anaerolineae bacterium]
MSLSQPTAPLLNLPVPPRRSSWILRLLFAFLALGILAIGSLAAVVIGRTVWALAGPGRPAAEAEPQPDRPQAPADDAPVADAPEAAVWDQHGPLDILLMGLDIDDCEQGSELATASEARRTDTMILVHIDPATDRAAMFSLPRDLYVYLDIPYGEGVIGGNKLNTAHVFGTRLDEDGKAIPHSGPNAVKRAIQQNLDLSVHRYIRVDFQGFKAVVDALGGVDIDIPPSADDPTVGLVDSGYPDGHCGTMTLRFLPGRQHLDGTQALQYARSRKSTSDFDRSRRQMDVLLALRAQAIRPGVILDLHKLIPATMDAVDTDLTTEEILALARIGRRIDPAAVTRLQLDTNAGYGDMLPIGSFEQWVLRLDSERYALLREAFLNFGPDPFATPPATATATAADPAAER